MTLVRHFFSACAVLTLGASIASAQVRPKPWAPPTEPAASASEIEDNDADMPPIARGVIDKEQYVKLRQQYLEDRLDAPVGVANAARMAAIRTMKRQAAEQAPFAVFGSWTAIGPDPIPNGQTTTISTPVSGRLTSIVVDPTDPNIVYVGAAQGGVYRSLDGGATWTAIFDQAASLAIGALALSPADRTVLFVGTGESSGSCDSYFGVGLYRIENATTTPILHGPFDPLVTTGIPGTRAFTGRSISDIVIHPSDPNSILVSTTAGIGGLGCDQLSTFVPPLALRGLYRSTDAMSASPSFTKIRVSGDGSVAPDASGNRNISDLQLDPDNANKLVLWYGGANTAGNGGVFVSTNPWAPVPTFTNTFTPTTSFIRAEISVAKTGGTTKWMIATGESSNGRVRRSYDAMTWSGTLGGSGFCGGQCFYDIAITMPPADTGRVLLGGAAGTGLYQRSTNGGATFAPSATGLHADVHAITIAPSDPNVVYLGCDGGVYRSNDGGVTWTSRNTAGLSATQFQSLDLHPLDINFSIGGTQDNGTNLYRPDGTWFRADFGDGGFATIDQNAVDNTNVTMYHTYFNQVGAMAFAKVTNTAAAFDGNWQAFGCGFGGVTPNGFSCSDGAVLFYAPLVRGPGSPNTLYYGSDRLYRSANAGVTMSVASQAPFQAGVPVTAIGIAPQNDNIRLVGLRNGRVFSTTTGSSPLADVTGSLPARFVTRFAFDPVTPTTAYATFAGFGLPAGHHVWKSTDITNPAAWVPMGTGIPDVPVNGIVIDPLIPANLYAATDIGVYASTDGGASWSPFMTGMPIVAGFEIRLHPVHRILKVATHGRGIYERALDAPVATQLALVGTEFVDGRARLTWFSSDGAGEQVRLYRRFVPGEFQPLATLPINGEGLIEYEDADLIPGQSYEYEVGVFDNGRERRLGRVWLDVPAGRVLSVRSATGRPGELKLAVQLPTSEPASVDLVDVTGRRVSEQRLAGLTAGDHEVQLKTDGVRPGMYWARLRQAGKVVTAKVVHSR